jgi:hypothetical protein
MTRVARAISIGVLLLVTVGCGSRHESQQASQSAATAAGAPQLRDLHNIGQLRSLFNTRSREPRLILLVSPT